MHSDMVGTRYSTHLSYGKLYNIWLEQLQATHSCCEDLLELLVSIRSKLNSTITLQQHVMHVIGI